MVKYIGGFALKLNSINEYELAIEELEKIGYKFDVEWNEIMLNGKLITWGINSYLICLGYDFLELHNHDGGEKIMTLEEIINNGRAN